MQVVFWRHLGHFSSLLLITVICYVSAADLQVRPFKLECRLLKVFPDGPASIHIEHAIGRARLQSIGTLRGLRLCIQDRLVRRNINLASTRVCEQKLIWFLVGRHLLGLFWVISAERQSRAVILVDARQLQVELVDLTLGCHFINHDLRSVADALFRVIVLQLGYRRRLLHDWRLTYGGTLGYTDVMVPLVYFLSHLVNVAKWVKHASYLIFTLLSIFWQMLRVKSCVNVKNLLGNFAVTWWSLKFV